MDPGKLRYPADEYERASYDDEIAMTPWHVKMKLEAPGRQHGQIVFLWASEGCSITTKIKYDPLRDGPIMHGGNTTLPSDAEKSHSVSASPYLEVGIVAGINPYIYEPS